MVEPDTLTAENRQMVGAVEVLDPLGVFPTQLLLQGLLVLVCPCALLEIEVGLGQDGVLLNDFIKNVDVQWQSLCTLELLH